MDETLDETFSAGQHVQYTPIGGVPGRYVVTRAMPLEGSQSERMYRIKGELHGDDRMVAGSTLTSDVGSTEDYEQAALERSAARQKR